MNADTPVAVYGLEVPSGDMMIQGNPAEFPAPGKVFCIELLTAHLYG